MATAGSVDPNLLGVRKTLTDKYGVVDDRIGFNEKNGYVTIDGQDLFKPQKIENNTAYTTNEQFSSYKPNINQLNQTYNAQQQAYGPPPTNQVDDPTNAILQSVPEYLKRISEPIDPYKTEQYKAAQAQSDRYAQQGIRTAQESLGASGFGRSTRLSQGAQRIQNDANAYLETQVLPQIINQIQAQRQAELGNVMDVLGVYTQQQGLYDNRASNQQDTARQYLDWITGRQDVQYERDQASQAAETQAQSQAEETEYNRLWDVAKETGRMPDALADMYGIPRGTRTLDAEKVGITRMNAETSRMNAQTSQKNASTTAGRLGLDREKFEVEQSNTIESGALTANQFLSSIQDLYTEQAMDADGYEIPGQMQITRNPEKREQMFWQVVDAGYDNATTDQILGALGFTTEEVNQYAGE